MKAPKPFFDLKGWPNHFNWILSCRPANQCELGGPFCKFCTRHFCPRHGQYQRIETCNRVLGWGKPTVPCWSAVLTYGVLLDDSMVRQSRNLFFDLLKREVPQVAYLWRLEWKDFVPHMNTTILCYGNLSKTLLKSCWESALTAMGHPAPSAQRISCYLTEDYAKWTNYIFKTKVVLPASECPPRAKSLKWRYWSSTKNYQKWASSGTVVGTPQTNDGSGAAVPGASSEARRTNHEYKETINEI